MNNWEILLAATILLSMLYGIDDLFIDATYWFSFLRRFVRRQQIVPLKIHQLMAKTEQRVAIMVPCWEEDEVVGASLKNTIYTVQYSNFDVFVGVYPNDPDTGNVVKSLLSTIPNLHPVVCPEPGPTSKADNLNSIMRGIKKHEKSHNVHYDIFVLHDAEDVVHPLSLKLYNHLLPRKDMIQIPVFPLEMPLRFFTHWTYADEFAENHTKDILTREMIGGFVPSAGVGTAFSRSAIDLVMEETKSELESVFSTKTLTEDYAFSLQIKKKNLKSIFVHQAFEHIREAKRFWFFGPTVLKVTKEWIATRALFPVNYAASIRQKSRWILGISLQEWKESGWMGNAATRYTLFRDRKGPLGHLICVLGYFFLLIFASGWMNTHIGLNLSFLPRISHENRIIWTLLLVNALFMCQRILQRFIAVARIYGFWPAVFSPVRIVYGNFINAHAFLIALTKFYSSLRSGRRPTWAKTSNVFPSTEQLARYRRRLGDLLLDSASVTPAQLKNALVQQAREKKRLGAILIQDGIVSEEKVLQCIAKLYSMNVVNLDSYLLKFSVSDLPSIPSNVHQWLRKRRLVPINEKNGRLLVALADPTDERLKKETQEQLSGYNVNFVVAPPQQIEKILSVP